MAIFKYHPSPFCVLDDVDAPLDDANIGRLTRLLTEMAIDTQFIVITHSKRTMEAAQAMYGATMQEAGVSKLVSVKSITRNMPGDRRRRLRRSGGAKFRSPECGLIAPGANRRCGIPTMLAFDLVNVRSWKADFLSSDSVKLE